MNVFSLEPLEARIAPATLSIAALPNIPEGDSGTSVAQFKVTLSEPVAEGATVSYATANGSATAGTDYTAAQGTLTFASQQIEQIISIDILGDFEVESDETFMVTLSSPTNATIAPGEETGTGTITDDDPKVHVAAASVVEGTGALTFLDFRVFLSSASPDTITVDYRTLDGTASSESDYDLVTGTLVFNPNETEKIVRVPINSDSAGELDETLFLRVSNPVNASLGDTPATGTIINDDATLRVSDATVLEGAPGATTFAEFSVILQQATTFPVTVRYTTQDLSSGSGRALAGTDYDLTEGTLSFTGSSTQIVRVPIRGDNLSEGKETFLLTLSNASNADIAAGTATGNIFDDERNVVSVSDAFIAEGDTGQANMVFVVSLQHGASGSFELPYATENGTATSGATDPDFVAQQGQLTFSPGETAKVITVPILGDVRTEEAETFKLVLGMPTNSNEVFVLDGEAIGTITDNDPAITVTIGNTRVAEGNGGSSQQAIFTVRLSDTPRQPVTVKVSTVDGSATSTGSEADFIAISEQLLTFNPGAPLEQEVAVTIIGDARDERDETFSLRLSEPAGGHIGDSAEAVATIANDEATLSVSDVTVTEGTGGTTTASFIVTLSTAAAQPVSVDFTTVDGTARSSGTFTDFVAKTERLTFAPGELSKTVAVTVQSDARDEGDESFIGRLQNAANATLLDADGTAVITDDDVAPTLSVADVAVEEGNAAPARQAVFTIKLSAPSERPVAVKTRSANGTAVADEDYTALPDGTAVTFAPGETEKTISVPLIPDTVDEADETFAVEFFEAQFMEDNQPAGAVEFADNDSSATGTIVNDDLTIVVGDATVTEGDGGTVELRFVLTLSAASTHPVTLQFATSDGSAVSSGSGADYLAQSGAVTFAPGETTKEVAVLVNGDERNETNETLTLLLSAAQNAVLADSSAVGTILNDEITFTLEPVGATTILEESGNVAGVARFRIVRSAGDLQVPVSVAFTTQNGTALTGGDRPDYTARSGTVTFSGSEVSSAIFEVPILADDHHENDETFKVVLSSAVDGSVASGGGELQFTIDDNDAAIPTVTIEDATVVEGDPTDSGGKKTLFFNVRLSAVNEANVVRVVFETEDGTARSIDPRPDYEKPVKNDTTDQTVITFAPGETVQRIGISVLGDLVDELDNAETFLVRLTEAKLLADGQPVGDVPFTGGDNTAIGTIQDNDVATLSFDLTAAETTNGVHVGEGTGATTLRNFTVKLSHETESGVTVNLAVVDGSATRQTDLATPGVTPGSLTFAAFADAAERMQTVTLHVAGDAVDETNETLELRLADAVNAAVDTTRGHVDLTIDDDDPAPVLAINNVTIEEGDSGTKDLVFTVTLSGLTEQIVKYDFATVEGTAKSTGPAPDYQAVSGTREFRPGEPTSQEIRVPIFGDQLIEGSEANRSELFDVRLSGTTNATLAVATGTGTILDDADTLVGVIIKDRRQVEGNSGNSAMTFELELSGASPQPVTFQASTRSGTAASGSDFVRLNDQTITISAQSTTSTVSVQIIGDNGFEGGATESFFVALDNPSANAVLVDPEARGTIYNDDLLQVNAQTVKYIDADGDVATVRVSQGFLTIDTASSSGVLVFSATNSIGGRSLQVIDLAGRGEFKGTSISVTAEKQNGFPGGLDGTPSDGEVDVGFIRAALVQNATLEFTNGIDLGRVVVEGDLGKIVAGDKVIPNAVGTIDVLSFGSGKVALPFSDDLGDRTSAILATINQMIVRGDFEGNLRVIGDQFGTLRKLRVDGAFKGGSDDGAALGQIFFTGVLAKAQFGSIAGGAVQNSALITGDFASAARIGSLKVLGDVTGGAGQDSALIVASKIKTVTIGGSLEGGAGGESGSIISGTKIKTVKIGEDLRGGAGSGSGTIQASGDVQQIKLGNFAGDGTPVNGNLAGSTGNESGRIQVNGDLHSLRIGGDVTGGTGNTTGGVDVGGRLDKAQLDGDLRGGDSAAGVSLTNSGFIAAGRINAMILEGDLVAGTNNGTFIANAGAIRAADTIGKLTIEGAVLGNATNAAIVSAGGSVHNLAIDKLEIGGHARFAEILAGYSPQVEGQGTERGRLLSADAQIESVEIAGEVEAINIVAGADAGADRLFGTDDDSVIASSSGAIIDRTGVVSRIARVVLSGAIVANDQAHGIVAQHLVGITTGASGTPVPLAKGPGNDLAARPDILVGENFRALELPLPI